MTANAPKLPLPVRLMNLAGRAVGGIGLRPVDLRAETLLQKAQRSTGLSDFGGDEFRKPLALLVDSLEKEARLSLLGRLVARSDLLRTLENRLRLVDLFRQHPEIADQPIERPIFVVGPPRSGTTIFHSDARIARVQADLDRVDRLLPEFKKMHPMGAERAQECVAITSHDLASMIYQTQFDVPSYDGWVLDHDMKSALQWHRRFLQVLQWKAPGKRWALKSPQHLWHIQHVHREYPDALFVQTHRDPVRVLASISNLVTTLRRLASDDVSPLAVAEYYAWALAKGYDNTVAYRRSGRLPESQVVDLYFHDFMRDPVGTVGRAYEHFGLALSAGSAAAMQGFLDENPSDKHGRHLYSFGDVGMDEGRVREMFHGYQSHFEIPSEPV